MRRSLFIGEKTVAPDSANPLPVDALFLNTLAVKVKYFDITP
jgi:hypothetical protein